MEEREGREKKGRREEGERAFPHFLF